MANIDNVQTLLAASSQALVQRQYDPEIIRTCYGFGGITQRIFTPTVKGADGDGIYMKVKTGRSDSSRASRDMLSDFGTPTPFTVTELQLRFNDQSQATNDFARLSSVAKVTQFDLQGRKTPESAVDFVEEVERDLYESNAQSFSVLLYANANARVALVSGTPKNNSATTMAAATTYTAGATGFRIWIDNGSINFFREGTEWDFYSAAGVLQADAVQVTDYNPTDTNGGTASGSVGFQLTSRSTVLNCNNVADNAEVFRSDERGSGFRGSLTEWMNESPSSGENFIGGRDRSLAANRFLIPTVLAQTATPAVKASMLDDLATAMQFVQEETQSVVCLLNPRIYASLRKEIGDSSMTEIGPAEDRNFNFGVSMVTYHHPQFGRVAFVSDPGVQDDRLYMLDVKDWNNVYYQNGGMTILAGDTVGNWSRLKPDGVGKTGSMFYAMNAYRISVPFCRQVKRQGKISGIKA